MYIHIYIYIYVGRLAVVAAALGAGRDRLASWAGSASLAAGALFVGLRTRMAHSKKLL